MRIAVMDKVFNYEGLGAIVARHVPNPASSQITVEQVVNALHEEQQEVGISKLFHNCCTQFSQYDKEKRLGQLAEGACLSYKILKAKGFDDRAMQEEIKPIREKAAKYDTLFQEIVGEQAQGREVVYEIPIEQKRQEVPEAEAWFASLELSLAEIEKLAEEEGAIKEMHEKTKEFAKDYAKKNGLTTHDGKKIYTSKSLHGVPYDQNRLGKLGEVESTYSDGSRKRKNRYHQGFEDFYISGSPIVMPYGTYDLMQAPLVKHDNKEDTVKDFWDTVVVMRKSPIIVCVHDPKEKIPRHGLAQRAEYWTSDRFPMKLRDGWELSREGEDIEVAKSCYYPDMRVVKRHFYAINTNTKETHTLTQYHFQGWPDHCGAPDLELLEKLHEAVDKEIEERHIPKERPITVHCAAGQGRSPVFAISHHERREICAKLAQGVGVKDIKICPQKTVYLFNKQRPSQLSGNDQCQSVLLSLRRFSLKLQGRSHQEIRAAEEKIEKCVLHKAEKNLKEDTAKRERESKK